MSSPVPEPIESPVRRGMLLATLNGVAAGACLAVAVAARQSLGGGLVVLLAVTGTLLVAAVLSWPRRDHSIEQQRDQLELIRRQLEEAAQQLEQRQRKFADRLATFHEWMEFPTPVQLAEPESTADVESGENEPEEGPSLSAGERSQRLAEQDRKLMELLQAETEKVFEKIRDNYYLRGGRLSAERVRDDALALIRSVAGIYQQETESPLLETSMALVLRAASRACLHSLVVLEQLPLDVKEMSVSKLYSVTRKAVQAYGVYKSANNYLPWLSNAYYLGRYAMGASPLTLGGWYATGTLGKQAARSAASRIVNHHALQLVGSVIRLIGFEAAQVYGGDFRRRDPNWIYAAELTEVVVRLPASARTLALALGEVGALQLRSEYDRVWFYRCLAAGKAAGAVADAAHLLSPHERSSIARRLERFVESLPSGSATILATWRLDVERRLGVQLGGAAAALDPSGESLRSLAGFLLEIKHLEPDKIASLLEGTRSGAAAPEAVARLADDPPFLLEYPQLQPGSDEAEQFLEDLVQLAAKLPGRGGMQMLLEEMSAYLRLDIESAGRLWDRAVLDRLRESLGEQLRGRPPTPLAVLALELIDAEGEAIRCAYYPARLKEAAANQDEAEALLLIADDRELAAWAAGEEQPRWRADRDQVKARRQRGLVGSNCQLVPAHGPTLTIEGSSFSRYPRHFEPLLELVPEE